MINAILHALIPVVFIAIIGRMLFLTLKYGVVVGGKREGERYFKKEQPARYWFFVACYAAIFVIALWLLILAIRYCFLVANWPKPPN